ncbi:MAG: Ser-Thr-rich GPI-anchored membrane family protein [Bacteroidota bacterium]
MQFVLAQNIELAVQATLVGDSVSVTYTLSDSLPTRTFKVEALGVTANDTFLLDEVSGDIGERISQGEHTFLWDALADLERFDGTVKILVKATPRFLFLQPEKKEVIKRGNPIRFQWYGDNATLDTLRVELYQFDKFISVIDTVVQVGDYAWKTPNDIEPGEGYRIRLIGTPISDLNSYSRSFTIKRKVDPKVWYYAAGGGTLAGIAAFIFLRQALPEPLNPR